MAEAGTGSQRGSWGGHGCGSRTRCGAGCGRRRCGAGGGRSEVKVGSGGAMGTDRGGESPTDGNTEGHAGEGGELGGGPGGSREEGRWDRQCNL